MVDFIDAVKTSKETVKPLFAPVNPNAEMTASEFAPVTPLVANAFNSSSFVHALVVMISPVVVLINLRSFNTAFCFSADKPA
ncbi:MAG: hypothetical protein NC397_10405 [Clostridium sp.]|nr:hypothetical protein [Clostridium sp.]